MVEVIGGFRGDRGVGVESNCNHQLLKGKLDGGRKDGGHTGRLLTGS